MATFSAWLDDYDGSSQAVAQLAAVWRTGKPGGEGPEERPRVHTVPSVSAWVLAHAPDQLHPAMREAQREYRAGRGGTVAPMAGPPSDDQQPDQAAGEPIVGYVSPGPATMASLGRIESMLGQVQQQNLAILDALRGLSQVTGLWGEPEATQGAIDPDQAENQPPETAPQVTGSLWRNIAVPEPDFAAMAADGDPAEEGRAG